MKGSSTVRLLAVSCAFLALGAALPDSSLATAPFSAFPRNDLAIGSQNSVAVVDVNADGKEDLATAHYQTYVSVYLGNGDGTFGPPSTFPIGGSYASSITAGDVNGDGKPDLVLSREQPNGVSTLLGVGDGTFGPPLSFPANIAPKYVRLGDFNNDGRLDVVAIGADPFVRLGNGDGTFGPRLDLHLSGCPFGEPLRADFNADGRLDLALANPCPYGTVSVLLGNGNGTFQPQVDHPVQSNPDFGDVGDFNGDSHPDIVVSNFNSGSVSVVLGNGDGTFQPRTDIDIGYETAGVKVGDFNSDGIPDIGATTHGSHILFLLAGRGDGTFEPKLGFPTSPHPYSLQVGDLNGDALLDLLTPVAAPLDGLTILLNATGPPAGNPPVITAPASITVAEGALVNFDVTASDADGDPILGLTADVCCAGRTFTTNASNTSGTFSWTACCGALTPYYVVFTARNSLATQAVTYITVTAPGLNQPVVLSPVGNKTIDEQSLLSFTATATDPDAGQTLTFSFLLGAPAAIGATIDAMTGVFAWTPTEAQGPGQYPMTVRVTDNANPATYDFESIQIAVNEANVPPALAPIGSRATPVGTPLFFTVTASDADTPPNTMAFSLDAGAPAGAAIGASSGAFNWTPSSAGTFPVTIRVTDNGSPPLSDFEAIQISVCSDCGSAPVLGAIGDKTVAEQTPLSFTASATDPDAGQTLTFSLDAGAPAGAAITTLTGAFSWTPTEGTPTQAQGPGVYPITVRVTDNGTPALSDFETIMVTVNEVNVAPILAVIGNKTVTAGSLLAFFATATDADFPPNTQCFTLANFPPVGATINCGTGAFSWTPTLGQVGVSAITVRVTDDGLPPLSDEETILVTVLQQTGAPTAHAGGPYSGIVDSPVIFDGTGSSDPNGDALTYHWNFGDGNTGSGATPSHAYTTPGIYNVTLRVTDPDGNFDEDVTSVTIGEQVSVALVLKNGKSTLDLGGNELVKVGIENTELVYTDVIVGSIRLSTDYPNAGTVSECAADPKHTRVGDLDRNSVPDLEVRSSLDCMRNLFRNVPNNTVVNLIVTGEVRTTIGPVPLRGAAAVTIKKGGGGGGAAVLVYPNPMNPQAILSFVTNQAGGASVQLFDLQGRLVRTLLPEQHLEAGAHEVTIDGMNDQGTHLSSGIYFYRVRTADGTTEGSISVLK